MLLFFLIRNHKLEFFDVLIENGPVLKANVPLNPNLIAWI